MRHRLAFLLATGCLLSGCDASTAPDETIHRLALLEVAGQPVSFPMRSGGLHEIVADSILLYPGGTGAHVIWWRQIGAAQSDSVHWPLYWRYRFGRMEINSICGGPAIDCIAPPHMRGRFTGNTFDIDGGARFPDGARYRWVTAP